MTITFIPELENGVNAHKKQVAYYHIVKAHECVLARINNVMRHPDIIERVIGTNLLFGPNVSSSSEGFNISFANGYPYKLKLWWYGQQDEAIFRDAVRSLNDYPDLFIPPFNVNLLDENNKFVAAVTYTTKGLFPAPLPSRIYNITLTAQGAENLLK